MSVAFVDVDPIRSYGFRVRLQPRSFLNLVVGFAVPSMFTVTVTTCSSTDNFDELIP